MKAELQDASLTRYAGRFVWLELDFDRPGNQPFIARNHIEYTPTLLIVDPHDEHVIAKQLGGLALPEMKGFLDNAADPGRALAAQLWTMKANDPKCAELALANAPKMKRDASFARVVLAAMRCSDPASPSWKTVESLAIEAIDSPATLRDHRFQIYQQFMAKARAGNDHATLQKWGDRWLAEIASIKPADDDERSALDVARDDAASLLEQPERVIPALIESERAMPDNYNAPLRLAQMQLDAKHYDEAIAAVDRGLQHVTGPLGRMWLLETKGEAQEAKGDRAAALRTLDEALRWAKEIGGQRPRERNVAAIEKRLTELRQ